MIDKTSAPLGLLLWCLYAAYAVLFLQVFSARLKSALVPLELACVVIGVGVPLFFIVRQHLRQRSIARRPTEVVRLAQANHLDVFPKVSPTLSTNFMVLKPREPHMSNALAGPDWRYADFRQTIYRKFRNGEYRTAYVYYSVLELDLPRALPTMLFDSPKTHRDQFKTYFDRAQIHHLEGDFDQHFTTYLPKYYTIDALSIITPEVMQAMIAADGFDIEIDGAKLYLYGPLLPVEQLPAMFDQGKTIRKTLMNNLTTYRDERLNALAGRSGVSVYGTELRKNPFHGWLSGIFAVPIFAVYFLLSHQLATLAYGLVLLIPVVYGIWQQWHKNRQLDKQYARHVQFLKNQEHGLRKL